jgi:hypothetical protein
MRKTLLSASLACLFIPEARALDIDATIDQLDETLQLSAFHNNVRARLSGTLDLEVYHFTDPAPGLIDTTSHGLFNPRLSLFLDAQAASQLYFFFQLRVDRGFDPSDHGVRVGADEYALRLTPWKSGIFSIQVGKFATVAGTWVERHLSWDNPFINAPLPYENVTAISDLEVPPFGTVLSPVSQKTKYEHVPFIWGPSYASGVSVAGSMSLFDYAVELKNSSLSSRPEVWDLTRRDFSDPTITSHLAFRPSQMWKFGFSASEGAYLTDAAQPFLSRGQSVGDFRQLVLGQDITFAWRHWQIWTEAYEVRFEVPGLGNADAVSYYIEAKYKFAPQLSAAIRWNQELFASFADTTSGNSAWSPDVSRIEGAVTYRFTSSTQLKLEYYFQQEQGQGDSHTVATQFTVRF